MIKMNSTQRKLVEDNHKLIYSFLQRHNLPLDAEEDWYGTAALGLCRAAVLYDSDKGAFSTYAYQAMLMSVREVVRSKNKDIQATYYLDSPIPLTDMFLLDIIPDNDDVTKYVDTLSIVKKTYDKMSARNKEVIALAIGKGMKYNAIGARLGITRQGVSRIVNRFRKRVAAALSAGNSFNL